VTGVSAAIEITAYPNHADIAGHPLNGRTELHEAIDYLYDRLEREASKYSSSRSVRDAGSPTNASSTRKSRRPSSAAQTRTRP
jgi:hypothetical protein